MSNTRTLAALKAARTRRRNKAIAELERMIANDLRLVKIYERNGESTFVVKDRIAKTREVLADFVEVRS